MKSSLRECGCDDFIITFCDQGEQKYPAFFEKGKGVWGKGKNFFSREKKFFPFPHKSFLYQRINRKGGAEAAEDGGDEADGADFAVSETL